MPPHPHAGINERAQSGFAKSSAYDAHRPTYSPTVVQFLLDRLGVAGQKNARILDLAAGTGKFTEALAAREERYDIVAVEPHDGMREVLATKKLPRVTVVPGTGESMPSVEDASVDAVIVAQAFHWFANMDALREIHRVMARHSALGLIWNVEDYNNARDHEASTAWEAKLNALTWSIAEESGDNEPRFRHLQWRTVFDEQVKKTPLSLLRADDDQLFSLPIGEHTEAFDIALPVEGVWERYRTLGTLAVLEGERLQRAREAFDEAVQGAERNGEGEVVVHGNTYAVWTTKIPDEGREELVDVERSA